MDAAVCQSPQTIQEIRPSRLRRNAAGNDSVNVRSSDGLFGTSDNVICAARPAVRARGFRRNRPQGTSLWI
jgi:hypothetical protein